MRASRPVFAVKASGLLADSRGRSPDRDTAVVGLAVARTEGAWSPTLDRVFPPYCHIRAVQHSGGDASLAVWIAFLAEHRADRDVAVLRIHGERAIGSAIIAEPKAD